MIKALNTLKRVNRFQSDKFLAFSCKRIHTYFIHFQLHGLQLHAERTQVFLEMFGFATKKQINIQHVTEFHLYPKWQQREKTIQAKLDKFS